MQINFTVNGKPFGKQRPKFSRVGNYVKTYTPDKTVNYENLGQFAFMEQVGSNDNLPFKDALEVSMIAYYPIAKSKPKKTKLRMSLGYELPTKKPDCDNIAKAVLDALNGIAFDDDAQVVKLHVYKKYADTPRVEVSIREVFDYDQSL